MERDPAWLLDMLQAARKVLVYVCGIEEGAFQQNTLVQDAVLRQLTIIGEAAKQVSIVCRTAHPQIPWQKIGRFRDVAVHHYFRVDLKVVWNIVQVDIPALVSQLEPAVPPEDEARKGT